MRYVNASNAIDANTAMIVGFLTGREWTISFAESCTAGLAAAHLVDVPSASSVFNASFVTYSDEAKVKYLGVSAETIREKGVVSEEVAAQMAKGVAIANDARVGVGITGFAGPGGGTEDKPVGTVCFGFYINGEILTSTRRYAGLGRDGVRIASVDYVYSFLYSVFSGLERP